MLVQEMTALQNMSFTKIVLKTVLVNQFSSLIHQWKELKIFYQNLNIIKHINMKIGKLLSSKNCKKLDANALHAKLGIFWHLKIL